MIDDARADQRRKKRMAFVDAMDPAVRACVHEYGLTIVQAFLDLGVRNPKHIRHLVDTVRGGSYEIGRREEKGAIPVGWVR